MPTPLTTTAERPWCTTHPVTPDDKAAMAAMRAMVEPNKGKMEGIAGRGPYDAIMMRVAQPEGVSYRQETIGNVSGWWCEPTGALPGATILHLHGGWFNWGSAEAFRHLVGHIAQSAVPRRSCRIIDWLLSIHSQRPTRMPKRATPPWRQTAHGGSRLRATRQAATWRWSCCRARRCRRIRRSGQPCCLR